MIARCSTLAATMFAVALHTTLAIGADLDADLDSLEACVLESGASGHEEACIGILHAPCETALCFQRETALWRLVLLRNSVDESGVANRRMQDGDWVAKVRHLKQACEEALPVDPATPASSAACDRDAHALTAIDLLLGAEDPS